MGSSGFFLSFFSVLSQAEDINKEKITLKQGTPTHEVAQMVAKNSSHPEAYISVAQQEPRRQEGEAPSASLLLWHPEMAPPVGLFGWPPGGLAGCI